MLDPVDRPLKISKLEGAARQIDAAIWAMEAGKYDVAITLAGAAEGMLPDDGPSGFRVMIDRLLAVPNHPDMLKSDWVKVLNLDRDWLKHKTPELGDEREMSLDDAAYMIFRAASKLPLDSWSPSMGAFKAWYILRTNAKPILGDVDL